MARLDTHYALSLGVTAMILKISIPTLLGFVAAVGTDWVIDTFGHTWGRHWFRRTPLTHSIITAPFVGLGVGLLIGVLFQFAHIFAIGQAVVGGLVASGCHLFLDSLTEGGIFIPSRFKVKKK